MPFHMRLAIRMVYLQNGAPICSACMLARGVLTQTPARMRIPGDSDNEAEEEAARSRAAANAASRAPGSDPFAELRATMVATVAWSREIYAERENAQRIADEASERGRGSAARR